MLEQGSIAGEESAVEDKNEAKTYPINENLGLEQNIPDTQQEETLEQDSTTSVATSWRGREREAEGERRLPCMDSTNSTVMFACCCS